MYEYKFIKRDKNALHLLKESSDRSSAEWKYTQNKTAHDL